jgi:hypothetical protein
VPADGPICSKESKLNPPLREFPGNYRGKYASFSVGRELNKYTHSRVSTGSDVRIRKTEREVGKGDRVFKHINRKSGEVGSIPAIRVGDSYVQGKEAVRLFAQFYGKPEIGRKGFDLIFGLIVARTLLSYLKSKYQSLLLDGTLNTPPNDPELIKLLTSLKASKNCW